MRSSINMYNEVKESAWTNFWDNANRLVPFVVVFGFVILISVNNGKEQRMRDHAIFTHGIITGFEKDESVRRNHDLGYFTYTYLVNNVTYSGKTGTIDIDGYGCFLLRYKTFPVIYDETDVENSAILVTPYMFTHIARLPFPDSLNWVKGYMNLK